MKISPRQISDFLAKPPETLKATLFHGNDAGLVRERARQLALLYNENLDDVFSVTRITGDMIKDEVGLIADSAASIPAFGTKRLVLVKGRGADLLDACKLALSTPHQDSMIIIEASDTTTRHAIVKLFDDSKIAASIGCYADTDSDIRNLALSIFKADNIKIDRDALEIIISRLGSDRATSRGEIEKLALLAGSDGTLTTDIVQDALGDSAALAVDDIADALANGRINALQAALQKAWLDDANAVMVLRGCQSYFRHLTLAGYAVAAGQTAQSALRSLKPPVHFKLQDKLQAQIRRWPPARALAIVSRLQDIETQVKSGQIDEQILTGQSLLGICLRAPR